MNNYFQFNFQIATVSSKDAEHLSAEDIKKLIISEKQKMPQLDNFIKTYYSSFKSDISLLNTSISELEKEINF